jgi:hypothetical protein
MRIPKANTLFSLSFAACFYSAFAEVDIGNMTTQQKFDLAISLLKESEEPRLWSTATSQVQEALEFLEHCASNTSHDSFKPALQTLADVYLVFLPNKRYRML